MSSLRLRELVIVAYVGKRKHTDWEKKVNKMSDSQVQALYLNLKRKGILK